jgi:hypothetical protein
LGSAALAAVSDAASAAAAMAVVNTRNMNPPEIASS